MDEKSAENRRKLINSLELVCLRQYVTVCAVLVGLPVVAAVLFSGHPREAVSWSIGGLIFLLGWLPVVIFCLWRHIAMLRRCEGYAFYRAKLVQPYHNPLLRTMYFTVLLEEPDGNKFVVNTHAIFFAHGIIEPLMEHYLNKTVTIAHNEETGMVVVIG